jgi:hypothetical protein
MLILFFFRFNTYSLGFTNNTLSRHFLAENLVEVTSEIPKLNIRIQGLLAFVLAPFFRQQYMTVFRNAM